MDFSPIDRSNFRTLRREESAELFVKIDYEVQLIFDGIRLTYRLIVPELGQFRNWDDRPESQHDRHWGKHYYQAEATMENIAAAYDVSGYRTGKAHADKPSSSFRGNTTSATSGEHDRTGISPRQQGASQSRPLSQGPMTTDSSNSIVSTSRNFGPMRTSGGRPRQRPCRPCLRSKQKLPCVVSPQEKRCIRCVRLHLTCKP